MDEGQRLADDIELKFATKFSDFRDMSTMVGLTAGASCSDIGITKEHCRGVVADSVQSQIHLQSPTVRTQLLKNFS